MPLPLSRATRFGAIRIEREGPGRDAFGFQHLLQIVDGQDFVAGGGVHLHQGAVPLEDFAPKLCPVDDVAGGRLCAHAGQRGKGEGKDEERFQFQLSVISCQLSAPAATSSQLSGFRTRNPADS